MAASIYRPGAASLPGELTICIKHTSRFARRRLMLRALLTSIREQHGYGLKILVADDGVYADRASLLGAELLELPAASGLSAGRNALVQATQTPFFALLDDDEASLVASKC